MKTELLITKGRWEALESNLVIVRNKNPELTKWICQVHGEGELPINEAKLIADAGTTANATGLLPSELLAQRDELREALKYCMRNIDRDWADMDYLNEILNKTK